MPFGEFSIESVKSRLGLALREVPGLFDALPPVPVSDRLAETLAEAIPLTLAFSTEKARSELLVVPVLLEARRRAGRPVSLCWGSISTSIPTGDSAASATSC